MQAVEQQYGRLDYALNNAGIAGERAVLHEYPTDTFDDVMAVNVRGVWLCMKHQLPLMLKHPELDAAIVVTSSTAGEGLRYAQTCTCVQCLAGAHTTQHHVAWSKLLCVSCDCWHAVACAVWPPWWRSACKMHACQGPVTAQRCQQHPDPQNASPGHHAQPGTP